jgi:hypothetical protein
VRLESIPPPVPNPNPSCFERLSEGTTGGFELPDGLEVVAWALVPFLKSCHVKEEFTVESLLV